MQVVDRKRVIGNEPELIQGKGLEIVTIARDKLYRLQGSNPSTSDVIVTWKIAAPSVKGLWAPDIDMDKRLRADWEAPVLQSSISTHAPIICLYDHHDQNILTLCCDEMIHQLNVEFSIREEDSQAYIKLCFPSLLHSHSNTYDCHIRLDYGDVSFSRAIEAGAEWLASRVRPEVMRPPAGAFGPVYSTWYSYHQSLEPQELLEECRIASSMGYSTIIVDDGWQTLDDARGYDFTGDWLPERIPQMANFVDEVHALGMSVMLWYSVPFCGKKSEAYKLFRGKFLTENHHWAPVFDPRYKEVRQYLVSKYMQACQSWNIDGFKLDFIDDFKTYPETGFGNNPDRELESIQEAVALLIQDIRKALIEVNSEVLIEFRQAYINPYLRLLGNMFRAFDCPNDAVLNRVRTTDVRLLCGDDAVHSDMITWDYNSQVEVAALQFNNILFSVPQISVRLRELPDDHVKMIKFYTRFWLDHQEVLMHAQFCPEGPSENYPILRAYDAMKELVGVYADVVVDLDLSSRSTVKLINGKMSGSIILKNVQESVELLLHVQDCMGQTITQAEISLDALTSISVPASGIISLYQRI